MSKKRRRKIFMTMMMVMTMLMLMIMTTMIMMTMTTMMMTTMMTMMTMITAVDPPFLVLEFFIADVL